jgi:hypothetical protein
MRRETDRFEAVASDGERCTIVEYTNMVPIRTTTRQGWGRGSRSYETDTGRHISPIDDHHFRDVMSEKVFVLIDD